MRFTVQAAPVWTATGSQTWWKAVGYNGPGANFPTESEAVPDKAKAEEWADRANAGDMAPEAKWGMYADD